MAAHRSLSDDGRLYVSRGLCPNRYELLSELFKIRKYWIVSFVYLKKTSEINELSKLKFLYISRSKKLFFIPNHHDDSSIEEKEIHGYFLSTQRKNQDNNELVKEHIDLFPITTEDVMEYMPPLSPELIEKLSKNHPISINSERFKRAKWTDLIAEKESKDEIVRFYSAGFSRFKDQTTGSVYGHWE